MDPDALLRRIGELADAIKSPDFDQAERCEFAYELADAIEDMDGYLSRGGMFPKGWTTHGRIGFTTSSSRR